MALWGQAGPCALGVEGAPGSASQAEVVSGFTACGNVSLIPSFGTNFAKEKPTDFSAESCRGGTHTIWRPLASPPP